jgi:hypothetical protein
MVTKSSKQLILQPPLSKQQQDIYIKNNIIGLQHNNIIKIYVYKNLYGLFSNLCGYKCHTIF